MGVIRSSRPTLKGGSYQPLNSDYSPSGAPLDSTSGVALPSNVMVAPTYWPAYRARVATEAAQSRKKK